MSETSVHHIHAFIAMWEGSSSSSVVTDDAEASK